jgi:hypothetical protein
MGDPVEPYGRSRFWEEVAGRHARELAIFGFGQVKRRQALEYFTWQWGLGGALLNPQLQFLLRHSSPGDWWRAWRSPALTDPRWEGVQWSPLRRRVYTAAVRLLWDYAAEQGDRRVLVLPEPEIGGPLPVIWRGRLISQDLANTALEVAAMAPALEEPRSFLEVGAGYGRNAYALLSLFPQASYTIVDIEPALSIARWYLSQLFEPRRLRFLAPDMASSVEAVDVALTISTLQEMTPDAVHSYLQLFDRVGRWVYVKQWTSWRNPLDGVTMTMSEYPFPDRWERRLWRRAPVQTAFTEALWATRAGSSTTSGA